MADLGVSIFLLAAVVLVCEAARRAAGRLRSRDLGQYLVEAVSTLQLCACTQEVKLLADLDQLDPGAGLTLTYVLTCVHLATGRGASCNPVGVLDRLRRDGTRSARGAAGLVCCQFAAAVAARSWAVWVWGLGLSDLHAGIRESGFQCQDPIRGPLVLAAAVETLCAFCMQAASMQVHLLDPRLRIPAVSAVVTCLVYAGEPPPHTHTHTHTHTSSSSLFIYFKIFLLSKIHI